MNKGQLARISEDHAAFYLLSLGFEILDSNFSSAAGEIDIVTYRNGEICFIEVRGRKKNDFSLALESISDSKLEKIELTALKYLELNNFCEDWQVCFLPLTYNEDMKVLDLGIIYNMTGP